MRRGAALSADGFSDLPACRRAVKAVAATGNEPYFKRQVLLSVRSAYSDPEVIDLQEGAVATAVSQAFARLCTTSLFGGGETVVVVHDPAQLSSESVEALCALLTRANLHGTLVLDSERAVDGRTKLGKLVREHALAVDCKGLYATPPPWKANAPAWDTPLHAWVGAQLRKRGKRVPAPLLATIVECVGTGLGELSSTIEKLVVAAGPGGEISAKYVADVAAKTRRDGVFVLTAALGKRDTASALSSIERMFTNGLEMPDSVVSDTSAIAHIVLSSIERSFDTLGRVHDHVEAGGAADPQVLVKSLGISSPAAHRAVGEVRRIDRHRLNGGYKQLRQCYRSLREQEPPRRALETLVVALCA